MVDNINVAGIARSVALCKLFSFYGGGQRLQLPQ
jgi:hypothetical protein